MFCGDSFLFVCHQINDKQYNRICCFFYLAILPCLHKTPRSPLFLLSPSVLVSVFQRKCLDLISRTHRPQIQLLVLWRCAWTIVSNWTKNIKEEVGLLEPIRLDSQLKVWLHILPWRSQPNYTAALILLYTQWPTCVPLCPVGWLLFSVNVILYLHCWSVTSQRETLTESFVGGKMESKLKTTFLLWVETTKMSLANFSRRHSRALNVPTESILHLVRASSGTVACVGCVSGAVTQTEHRAAFILMLSGFYTRNTRVPEWSAPLVRCFLFWLW